MAPAAEVVEGQPVAELEHWVGAAGYYLAFSRTFFSLDPWENYS